LPDRLIESKADRLPVVLATALERQMGARAEIFQLETDDSLVLIPHLEDNVILL
jgi:hypothetical protein